MQKNWTILGTGAIGCLWASAFHQAGDTVTMIGRNVKHKTNSTLSYHGPDGIAGPDDTENKGTKNKGAVSKVPLPIEPASAETVIQKLIVCVKAHQVRTALASIRHRLAHDAVIILCQNGMGIEEEVSVLLSQHGACHGSHHELNHKPNHAIYWASITHGANKTGATTLHHAGLGQCFLGPGTGTMGTTPPAWLASLPMEAFKIQWDARIETRLQEKLAINCAINPLTALLDKANGVLLRDDTARALVSTVCEEFARVFDSDPEILRQHVYRVARMTQNNISSMLQDIRAGKPTEIDYITGFLLRRARTRHMTVPVNQTLYHLIHLKAGTKPDSGH